MEALLAWREEKARAKDITRQHILSDKDLMVLWKEVVGGESPSTEAQGHKTSTCFGDARMWLKAEVEARANELGGEQMEGRLNHNPLTRTQKKNLRHLQEKVTDLAETLQIPVPFLATKGQLSAWVRDKKRPNFLNGWRREALEPLIGDGFLDKG